MNKLKHVSLMAVKRELHFSKEKYSFIKYTVDSN